MPDDLDLTRLTGAWVTPVFRYHLSRRGNWADAETLTAQTFLDVTLGGDSDPVTLFRLAVTRQTSYRSGSIAAVPAAESKTLAQDQLVQRARITGLADYWNFLAPGQANAVALACFAGLEVSQISQVLQLSSSQVQTWLDQQAGLAARLFELAQATPLPDGFTAELREALAHVTRPTRWQSRLERAGQWLRWQMARSQPGLQTSLKLFPILLVGALIVYGAWTTLSQSVKPAARLTPPPVSPTPLMRQDLPAAGLLVPPPLSECQAWRQAIGQLLGTEAALNPKSNFSDPAETGQASYGLGCFITANLVPPSGFDRQAALNSILTLLTDKGYRLVKTSPVDFSFSTSTSTSPELYRGQGISLARNNERAVLEILGNSARPGAASPITGGDRMVVYLGLASQAAVPVIGGFTNAWASGVDQASQYLSSALRERLPDLAALDRLAGIHRSPDLTPAITWVLIDNLGDSLRFQLRLADNSALILPTQSHPPLQVVLSRENSQWKISALSDGIILPPSHDALILIDDEGQVYTQDLNSGERTNLTLPGFFPTQWDTHDPADSGSFLSDLSISPNGRWLYIAFTGGPAWLLSLDGSQQLKLDPSPTRLRWSPDGTWMAYVIPDRDNQLLARPLQSNLTSGATLALIDGAFTIASTPGAIRALSWSPLGDWIGLAYLDSGALSFARASTSTSGLFDKVWSIPWRADRPIPTGALSWTADQNELWFTPAEISIHLQDRLAYHLVSLATGNINPALQANALRVIPVAPDVAISPDSKSLAAIIPESLSGKGLLINSSASLFYQAGRMASVGKSGLAASLPPEGFVYGAMDRVQADAFAWTGDSQNLILLTRQASDRSPGGVSLTRLYLNTFEQAPVARAWAFLGLRSGLLSAGQPKPIEAQLARDQAITLAGKWDTYQNVAVRLSLAMPVTWNTWPGPYNPAAGDSLTLTNFGFTAPLGYASLRRGDVALSITRENLAPGETMSDWLLAQSSTSAFAVAFNVAGQPAYWRMRRDSDPFLKTLVFIASGNAYSIDWYAFTPDEDALVNRIIASIQIIP